MSKILSKYVKLCHISIVLKYRFKIFLGWVVVGSFSNGNMFGVQYEGSLSLNILVDKLYRSLLVCKRWARASTIFNLNPKIHNIANSFADTKFYYI